MVAYFRELLNTLQDIALTLTRIEYLLSNCAREDGGKNLYLCNAQYDTNSKPKLTQKGQ